MKVKGFMALYITLAFFLFLSCAPKASSPIAPGVPIKEEESSQVKAEELWQTKWESVLNAARKEGKLYAYISLGAQERQAIEKNFPKRYGIDIEILGGRGAELAVKLLNERGAGLYLADVAVVGLTVTVNSLKPANTLDPLAPALILPEVTDPRVWYNGELSWSDDRRLSLPAYAYPSGKILINTSLVKPRQIKSLKDLLKPEWKGKILINDPTVTGSGSKWFAMYGFEIVNLDYMRELARQEPVIIRDERLQVEWVAHGKYPLVISPKSGPVAEFMKAGAPVNLITPLEGGYLTGGASYISLVNRAPHPNAAMVFINWYLGRESGELISHAALRQSARNDVSSEGLPPSNVREAGIEYFNAEQEELLKKEVQRMEVAREIFGKFVR